MTFPHLTQSASRPFRFWTLSCSARGLMDMYMRALAVRREAEEDWGR
jgi:hypothetical protein